MCIITYLQSAVPGNILRQAYRCALIVTKEPIQTNQAHLSVNCVQLDVFPQMGPRFAPLRVRLERVRVFTGIVRDVKLENTQTCQILLNVLHAHLEKCQGKSLPLV